MGGAWAATESAGKISSIHKDGDGSQHDVPHWNAAAYPYAPHPTREVPLSLAGRAWRAIQLSKSPGYANASVCCPDGGRYQFPELGHASICDGADSRGEGCGSGYPLPLRASNSRWAALRTSSIAGGMRCSPFSRTTCRDSGSNGQIPLVDRSLASNEATTKAWI